MMSAANECVYKKAFIDIKFIFTQVKIKTYKVVNFLKLSV